MTDGLIRKRETSREELAKLAADGTLFAIFDACDEPDVPPKVQEIGRDRAACLYRGKLDEEHMAVAPFLVAVDSALLDWIFSTFEDRPWGIFLVAKTDLRTLRQHLRELLVVEGIDEKPMYFFYYDPRVLFPFLGSCDHEELEEFYGPVMAYGVKAKDEYSVELMIRETPQ